MSRAFSAEILRVYEPWGRCPRLRADIAPLALTCGISHGYLTILAPKARFHRQPGATPQDLKNKKRPSALKARFTKRLYNDRLTFLRKTSMMSCTSLMRRRNAVPKNPAPATAIVASSIATFWKNRMSDHSSSHE